MAIYVKMVIVIYSKVFSLEEVRGLRGIKLALE